MATNPMAMQLAHIAVATGTVLLFTWRAPFPRAVRLLFPFGYFTLFEYAVISRNYAIAFLLTLAAAATIAATRRRPALLILLLFLLTQTSIWGTGLALVMLAAALVDWVALQPKSHRLSRRYVIVSLFAVIGGAAICYCTSLPGPGQSFIARWRPEAGTGMKLMSAFGGIWNGWVPLPRPTRAFWNTNVLDDYRTLRLIASIGLFVIAVSSMLHRPAALVVLCGGAGGLTAFTYWQFVGATRHAGLLYVVLIAACWLGATTTRIELEWPRIECLAAACERRRNSFLAIVFSLQAIGGVGACIADHVWPFSAARHIAEYVRRELPADAVLVGYDDYTAAPVGAYLNRPVYSVQMDALPEFFSQNDAVRRQVTIPLLIESVERVRERYQRDVVVLLNPHRNDELLTWRARNAAQLPWRLVARFDDSTVADEGTVLYFVARGAVYSGHSVDGNLVP
jgi:hypothetical protein